MEKSIDLKSNKTKIVPKIAVQRYINQLQVAFNYKYVTQQHTNFDYFTQIISKTTRYVLFHYLFFVIIEHTHSNKPSRNRCCCCGGVHRSQCAFNVATASAVDCTESTALITSKQ